MEFKDGIRLILATFAVSFVLALVGVFAWDRGLRYLGGLLILIGLIVYPLATWYVVK